MGVKYIENADGRIWKWLLKAGGCLIEVTTNTGLTVLKLVANVWCFRTTITKDQDINRNRSTKSDKM